MTPRTGHQQAALYRMVQQMGAADRAIADHPTSVVYRSSIKGCYIIKSAIGTVVWSPTGAKS